MDVDVLTTVYEGRDDQHKAVTDRVVNRERQTTAEIEREQAKRAKTSQSQWNYTVLGSAEADRQRVEHSLKTEAQAQAARIASARKVEAETAREAEKAAQGQWNYTILGSAAADRQRLEHSLKLEAQAAAERIAGARKTEQELLEAAKAGAAGRQSLLGRAAQAVGAGGLLNQFQGAKAVSDDLKSVTAAEAAATEGAGALAGAVAGIPLLLAGVMAAALAAGVVIFGMAVHASEAGSHLHDLSAKTNVSVETLGTLQYAAKLSGSSLEAITGSIVIFNRNLANARNGIGGARDKFKELNVDLTDNEAAFNAVLQHLADMPAGAQRSAEAMKFFGRSGTEVLKLLEETGGSLDKLRAKLEANGTLISTEQANAADAFGDSMDRLKMRLEAVTIQIGNRFIPTLQKGLDLLDTHAEAAQQQIGLLGLGISALTTLMEIEQTKFKILLGGIEAFFAPQLAIINTIHDYFGETTIPAPKIPDPKPVPLPVKDTPERDAQETIQVVEHEVAEAERRLRSVQAEVQRLKQSGAITPGEAASRELAAESAASQKRLTLIHAQINARKLERDALEPSEDTATRIQSANSEIQKLEEQAADEQAKTAEERKNKLQAVQQEEVALRRDHLMQLIGIARQQIQNDYQYLVTDEQRIYDKGQESLSEFIKGQQTLLDQRYEGEKSAFERERIANGLIANPQDRQKAELDLAQRELEAKQKYQHQSHDITYNGYLKEREIIKQAFEQRLQIEEQQDDVELQRLRQRAASGEATEKQVEETRYARQRQRLMERLQNANIEALRLTGETGTTPEMRRDQMALAGRLAFSDFAITGVDPDKLKSAQLDIQKILKEIEAAQYEHTDKMDDARKQELEDALSYVQQLVTITDHIQSINEEMQQSAIDRLGKFPANGQAARIARQALDTATENARYARAARDISERLSRADLMKDRAKAIELQDQTNQEAEALERQHTRRLLEIDEKYDDERREEALRLASDITDILSAGLDAFQGNWSDIWRTMAQEALQMVRRIADELLKMSFEVLISGQTRGSGAGGLLGTLVNSIGSALFGHLFAGTGGLPIGGGAATPGGIGAGLTPGSIPGHAGGGKDVTGWSMVGENGPELEFFGRPTQIFSNSQSRDMMNRGKTEIYNITTPAMQQKSFVQKKAARESAEMVVGFLKTRK
jgi:hypothetical protein